MNEHRRILFEKSVKLFFCGVEMAHLRHTDTKTVMMFFFVCVVSSSQQIFFVF